jgi:hypothetical protein
MTLYMPSSAHCRYFYCGLKAPRYTCERGVQQKSFREKWRSPVISATGRQRLGMAMHSYFSTSNGKPGIVAASSSGTSWIRTPGSWITRILDHQDDAHPLPGPTYQKCSNHQLCQKTLQSDPILAIVILYRLN